MGHTDVDVAVVGSGAGGLAAALALARAGKKVVVFEQHYLPGGWCHSFPLGGYRFSPGVHYVGELQPGGPLREIYEGLGVANEITFFELNPDGFDHVLVSGERFDIPAGREAFAERLKSRFPAERAGIDGFLGAVAGLGHELNTQMEFRSARDVLTFPFRAPNVARWGLRSAQAMMKHYVRDPRLIAILSAQAGDHGLPPTLAPAAVHASVINHYFHGGYYPRGGGGAIPAAFMRAIKRAGGEVKLSTPVDAIVMDHGRAVGVRLGDGTEVRASHVISNADPEITYRRLVGEQHLSRLMRWKLARTRYSVSSISLFFAADFDARAAGLDSGNVWFYAHDDVDAIYRRGMEDWTRSAGAIPGLFLTVTTLKDPTKRHKGHHTMEAFYFVSYESFARWAHTKCGDRPESYQALKRELTDRMLETVYRVVPALRDKVVFAELGTPLTNVHYVAATHGNLYGTDKILSQVGPWAYQVRTEVPGLTLCGSSTLSHGVFGATLSGVAAAAEVMKCRPRDLLQNTGQNVRLYPAEDPSEWPESLRRHLRDTPVESDPDAPATL